MKILLGDCKAKEWRDNIFKPIKRMRVYIRIAMIKGLE
jgi:hypothetical protein